MLRLFVFVLFVAACSPSVSGDSDSGQPTPDAGALDDAGDVTDGGREPDAGDVTDGGREPDAGDGLDGGSEPDAGDGLDGGSEPDAGDADGGDALDGGTDPDAGAPYAPPADVEAFVERALLAGCLHLAKCQGNRFSVVDLPRCVSQAREHLADRPPTHPLMLQLALQALRDGRRRLPRDVSEDCLRALDELPCTGLPPTTLDLACVGALDAAVPEGGTCQWTLDCIGEATCVFESDDLCAGVCRTPAPLSCVSPGDCGPDRWCEDGACRRAQGPGASCASNDACGHWLSCTGGRCWPYGLDRPCDAACGPGRYCEQQPSRCDPLPGAGAACANGRCNTGLFCDPVTDTCVAKRADGASCNSDLECASRRCFNGLCDREVGTCAPSECRRRGDGACTALPSAGEACIDCEDARTCGPGLVCSERTGVCEAPAGSTLCSGSCTPGSDCIVETFGGYWTGAVVCEPLGGEGDPCRSEGFRSTCARGLACGPDGSGRLICQRTEGERCGALPCPEGSTCVQTHTTCVSGNGLPTEGEPCDVHLAFTGACADASLVCAPTSESSGLCLKRKAPGDSCTERFECGSLLGEYACDVGGTNTCVRRPQPGEPCILHGRLGLCDVTTGWCDQEATPPTCRAFRPDGEACRDRTECGPDLTARGCNAPSLQDRTRVCATHPTRRCGGE